MKRNYSNYTSIVEDYKNNSITKGTIYSQRHYYKDRDYNLWFLYDKAYREILTYPDNRRKTVCGVGINDVDYKVVISKDGKELWRCPFYKRWVDMLKRCYSKNRLVRYPAYKDCTVCEEWMSLSNFKAWMEKQDWEGNHLDKDLLVTGNKVYSPDTCVFIPHNVNSFLSVYQKGNYPLGVCYKEKSDDMINELSKPYTAVIHDKIKGSNLYLGNFNTPMKAHKAWQIEKLKIAEEYAKEKYYDSRINNRLFCIVKHLEEDIDNDYETKNLLVN